MQPLVSILIPCYNAGPWVAQCIQSALDQTYPHKEIVVVDDGSTDNSLEVIRSFGDRIRYETGPNRGGNVARNRLMHLSNGEWLEFLDADDFLLPTKIEKQIAMLADHPDADVFHSPVIELYGEEAGPPCPIPDDDLYANYFRWAYFTTTVLLLRKSAILEVGGWKEDQKVCQEHELILRLILAGKKFVFMSESLGVNRMQHANSVSRREPLFTLRQKMALSDRLEDQLLVRGQMTEVRRIALAQARYQAGRTAYHYDKDWARSLCAKAFATGPFVPLRTANPYYVMALRAFGLDYAESLGRIRRVIFGVQPNQYVPNSAIGNGTAASPELPRKPSPFLSVASAINASLGRLCLNLLSDSQGLIVINFHATIDNENDLVSRCLNPQGIATLDEFEQCVTYYLSHGFQAVSPMDVLRGLSGKKRYVMFTFDDGYANNLRVLPILERHRVPATFALVTDYILQNKPFWWDIIYRERSTRGENPFAIEREVNALLREKNSAIEKRIVESFGEEALKSPSEICRPMRPNEVRALAKHPYVFWANHTARHEHLTSCDPHAVHVTVAQAQDALQDLTGSRPLAMVYPYGKHNAIVRKICRELGLRLGFSMSSYKQPIELDLESDEAMAISRFSIVHKRGVAAQCRDMRIDWKPSWLFWGHPARRNRL